MANDRRLEALISLVVNMTGADAQRINALAMAFDRLNKTTRNFTRGNTGKSLTGATRLETAEINRATAAIKKKTAEENLAAASARKLTAQTNATTAALRKQQSQVQQVQAKWYAMRATALDMSYLMGRAATSTGIALGAVTAGVVAGAKAMTSASARMESYKEQLRALTGSTEAANAALRKITTFAVQSPLTFEETIQSVTLLKSQFVSLGDIFKNDMQLLRTMTNMAVFSGRPLDQVARSLLKIRSGFWRSQYMQPIGLGKDFLETIGIKWDSKRNRPAGLDATTGPAIFEKIMQNPPEHIKNFKPEELLQTKLTNVQDILFVFWAKLGDSFQTATKGILAYFTDFVRDLVELLDMPDVKAALNTIAENVIKPLGETIIGFLKGLAEQIRNDPDTIVRWFTAIASGIKTLAAAFAGFTTGATVATLAQFVATIALAGSAVGTPAGGVVAGIVALVAALGTAAVAFGVTKSKLDDMIPSADGLGKSTTDAATAVEATGPRIDAWAEGVKRTYDEVAQKSEELVERTRAAMAQQNADITTEQETAKSGWQRFWNEVKHAFATWVEEMKALGALLRPIWDYEVRQAQAAFKILGDVLAWVASVANIAYDAIARLLGVRVPGRPETYTGPVDTAGAQRLRTAAPSSNLGALRASDGYRLSAGQRRAMGWSGYEPPPPPPPVDPEEAAKKAAEAEKARQDAWIDIATSASAKWSGSLTNACVRAGVKRLNQLGFNIPENIAYTGDLLKYLDAHPDLFEKVDVAKAGKGSLLFGKDYNRNKAPDHFMIATSDLVANQWDIIDQDNETEKRGVNTVMSAYRIKSGALDSALGNFTPATIMATFDQLKAAALELRQGIGGTGRSVADSLTEKLKSLAESVDKARDAFIAAGDSVLGLNQAISDITGIRYGLNAAQARAYGKDKLGDTIEARGIIENVKFQGAQIERFKRIYGNELAANNPEMQARLQGMTLQLAQSMTGGYDFFGGLRGQKGAEDLVAAGLKIMDALKPMVEGYLGDAQVTAGRLLINAGTELQVAAAQLSYAAAKLAGVSGKQAALDISDAAVGLRGISGGSGGTLTGSWSGLASRGAQARTAGGSIAATAARLAVDPWGAAYYTSPGSSCKGPG